MMMIIIITICSHPNKTCLKYHKTNQNKQFNKKHYCELVVLQFALLTFYPINTSENTTKHLPHTPQTPAKPSLKQIKHSSKTQATVFSNPGAKRTTHISLLIKRTIITVVGWCRKTCSNYYYNNNNNKFCYFHRLLMAVSFFVTLLVCWS